MSVDDAKKAFYPSTDRIAWESLAENLDRLILEVRAEFGCQLFGDGGDCEGMPLYDPKIGGKGMCPSCEARAGLADAEAQPPKVVV